MGASEKVAYPSHGPGHRSSTWLCVCVCVWGAVTEGFLEKDGEKSCPGKREYQLWERERQRTKGQHSMQEVRVLLVRGGRGLEDGLGSALETVHGGLSRKQASSQGHWGFCCCEGEGHMKLPRALLGR